MVKKDFLNLSVDHQRLKYFNVENVVTLKMGSEVTQGH